MSTESNKDLLKAQLIVGLSLVAIGYGVMFVGGGLYLFQGLDKGFDSMTTTVLHQIIRGELVGLGLQTIGMKVAGSRIFRK
jgi:hypothetical protein